MLKRILMLWICFGLIATATPVAATDHYSYELSEELTPLIQWRTYGPDAFSEAVKANKPIFLLLTAPSWCYWCQVYESDEYLFSEEVYPYINEYFIPIYVDADRRQDLTRHYLEGGWPSTTVMAPNRERLYGFSGPRPIPTMLENLKRTVTHVQQSGFATLSPKRTYKKQPSHIPTNGQLTTLINIYTTQAAGMFDSVYGGFGQGRKFPQPRTLMMFLDRYEETGETRWLEMVEKTLENQYTKLDEIETNYNLFDPIEGGFHRYGTTQNYTPPHYEKMLYDNARLLQLYDRLRNISRNPLAEEVTEKTYAFLRDQMYDRKHGGFAGNVDAFDEDHYYGKAQRSAEKPRIERTKYTNWNSDAILTFFDIAERNNDATAQQMASETLTLFLNEMLTDDGPYHYLSPDGTRGVTGNLPDSASLLVASIEGYRVTKDQSHLAGATKIANYALANLYDWYGGGFFERNSPGSDLYALDEMLLTEKPLEENGMMAYGLLLLYEETDDLRYLNAAVKTVGFFTGDVPYLDGGYFLYRAAQELQSQDVLTAFEIQAEALAAIDQQGQESFFLSNAQTPPAQPSAPKPFKAVEEKTPLQAPYILLLLIALIAGFLSFLSPCTLPVLPAYLAAVLQTKRRQQILMSISFLAGLSILFAILGMSASSIGQFLKEHLTLFTQVMGIVIVALGVMTIAGKGLGGPQIATSKPKTILGAFFLGGTIGLSWTPCVGPILIAMLAIASTLSSTIRGGGMLFFYALGLGFPLVILSAVLQKVPKEGWVWKILRGKTIRIGTKELQTTSLIAGMLFIALGILIFSGTLYRFNQYVGGSEIQQWFFDLEKKLLELAG